MDKKKTSKKPGFCLSDMPTLNLRKQVKLKTHHPEETFKNHSKVGAALLESLIDNDTEAFIEILDAYLRINRSRVAKSAKMARSTVQLALSKHGNPTLKTLAKIVHQAQG